jgi:glutathione S-transferase
LRLHDYAASGNCYKVRLLLALLDRPYERVPVDIFGGDTLTPEFGRLNPLRETPVLELDDGFVVTQSNAILWYLAEGTPFLPASALERAQVVQWLFLEQERVMLGIGGARFRLLTGRDPEVVPARLALAESGLALLDAQLAGCEWLVGARPSIADVSAYAYAHVAGDAGFELALFPAVTAWLQRMRELPGYANDLVPYPENAWAGKSRSIYDA